MQITVNHEKYDFHVEEEELLGHLFMRLNDHFQQQSLSAISVDIDGEQVSAEQQEEMSQRPVSHFSEINVEVLAFDELARQTLNELKPLLIELKSVTESTVKNLHSGNTQEAHNNINSMIQVWAILFETITSASKLHDFKLSEINVDGTNMEHMIQNLSGSLKEIKKSLANQDYVAIADIFEYDMLEKIDPWLSCIDILGDHFKSTS